MVDAVGGEDLVPVVHDASAAPAIAPPIREAHRIGAARREEGGGCRGAPVHQQTLFAGPREAEPTDVGDGPVDADHPSDARIDSEALQHPQSRRLGADLEIALEGALPRRRRFAAERVETRARACDLGRERRTDRGEAGLVAGDQRRIGLAPQPFGQVERARAVVCFRHPSPPSRARDPIENERAISDSASRRGPCRKPGVVRDNGKGREHPSLRDSSPSGPFRNAAQSRGADDAEEQEDGCHDERPARRVGESLCERVDRHGGGPLPP